VHGADQPRNRHPLLVFNATVRRSIPALAAGFALLAAAPAGAAYREVGIQDDQRLPRASCPENCQVIAKVTGYTARLGTSRNPYRVNRDGKITAWSIRLGKPSASVISGFDDVFGRPSQARLSVLELGKKKRRAQLVAQSPLVDLAPYFGSSPTFALRRPIDVEKRQVLALTVPTWAPAFAVGLSEDNAWRAPRNPEDCNDVERAAVHGTVGNVRRYRCFYRTARLLYTATFVPDPKVTNPPDER
jgi:hypothetical protein